MSEVALTNKRVKHFHLFKGDTCGIRRISDEREAPRYVAREISKKIITGKKEIALVVSGMKANA